MMLPKIEICIEGYNIEQTDFYISHLVDKYNTLNELYKKSCEHIVFLEKECKDGFYSSLAETEKRIMDKIDSIEKRISDIEEIKHDEASVNNQEFIEDLSAFHSELEDIKSLLSK